MDWYKNSIEKTHTKFQTKYHNMATRVRNTVTHFTQLPIDVYVHVYKAFNFVKVELIAFTLKNKHDK